MKNRFLNSGANSIKHYEIDYDVLPTLGTNTTKKTNYKSLANYRDKQYLKPSGHDFFTKEVLNPFE